MDRKKILLVILFVIVIAAITIFLAPKTNVKPPVQTYTPLPTQEPTLSRINPDRCQPYKNVKAEISCEEALKQAEQAYPGEIYNIEFKEISYQAGKNAKKASVLSWLIYIHPDTPIEIQARKVSGIAVAVHPLAPKAYISIYFEENL